MKLEPGTAYEELLISHSHLVCRFMKQGSGNQPLMKLYAHITQMHNTKHSTTWSKTEVSCQVQLSSLPPMTGDI